MMIRLNLVLHQSSQVNVADHALLHLTQAWVLGIPKGRIGVRDRYVPLCKIPRRSVSPSPRHGRHMYMPVTVVVRVEDMALAAHIVHTFTPEYRRTVSGE